MTHYISLEARLTVGLFLSIAAAAKLLHPEHIDGAALTYGVGYRFRRILQVLPLLEVGLGTLLVAGLFLKMATAGTLALLAAMTFVVTRAILMGTKGECHCWGGLVRARLGWETVARNAVLIALLLLVLFDQAEILSFDAVVSPSGFNLPATDFVPALMISLCLVIVYFLLIRTLGLEYDAEPTADTERPLEGVPATHLVGAKR